MLYGFLKVRAVWTVLLLAMFLCCGLIIYNLLSHYKTRCTSQESCSNSYQSESARLSGENCRTACNTKECTEIANYILTHMNRSADPCKDFSTFACGNYRSQFERESSHSISDDLAEDIKVMIKDIIETSNETQIDGSTAQKLKVVYDSCINSKSSDMFAIRSMQKFLNQMGIPNWPHLDSNFSFRNPTFEETVGKLVPYQEDIFLTFVGRGMYSVLLQEQGLFNISVESEIPEYRDDWRLKKVIMRILYYAGMANEDISRTWEEFKNVENGIRILSIENSEVKLVCRKDETRKSAWVDCSHKNESENMLCSIWNSVVRNGGISTYVSKNLVEISCEHIHYIEKLPSVLSTYDDRALAHYIALRVFINNLKYMSFPIRKNLGYFIKRFDKLDYAVELDRTKFCVSWVAENMKLPLGLMYVNRMWGKDATNQLDDIMNEYKRTILQFLQEQDWICENAEQSLVQSVEAIENDISAKIEILRNTTKINIDYREFHPTQNDFFHNVMHHKRLQFIRTFWMNFEDFIVQRLPFFEVEAFGGQTIFFSFGTLQPPHFKYGYPKLFNIARIGQIIGHEIAHNVVGQLSHYKDEFGIATRQHHNETIQCLIGQYFSYKSKRIPQNVKGDKTVGENWCDNMSTKVTETIAEQLIRKMEADNFTLPGLPYSPEELFYISNAQLFCEIRSVEKEYMTYENDPHSPSEYRIIGPLQNSKRFSEVFHCPSTSYMNLKKRCIVFD